MILEISKKKKQQQQQINQDPGYATKINAHFAFSSHISNPQCAEARAGYQG
jgi:hypothetical protein